MTIKTFFGKVMQKIRRGAVTLYPESAVRGRVLVSYKTEPFFDYEKKEHLHTNIWECREIVSAFLRRGYVVDVIDHFNSTFKPRRDYAYFLDIGLNLERIGKLINKDCVKIFYGTTSHWRFNNLAEHERLSNLEKRRGVALAPRRSLSPRVDIECSDRALLLGNKVTRDTYAYSNKPISLIPISTTHTYRFLEDKDFEATKKTFVWLGGVGMVHKGLDLVLEAFSTMPDYKLFVCGNVTGEKDFEKLYWDELYNTPHIKTLGVVDTGSEAFREVATQSAALIYPSCSEGQSGAVVTSMHAGLIPVISYHSGVDVGDFGLILKENTVEEVRRAVRHIGSLSSPELLKRSREAWEYARTHHTREKFSEAFNKFLTTL